MNMKKFGKRIRAQREKCRLKQADIASVLRISAQAVSKWERGENAPDIATLPALAQLLGVSVDWLLSETGGGQDTFPATVFCTSVNHFAHRATELAPRDLAAWANTLYYQVTESVLRFDGVPVKYVGDGFLGFFAGTDHAGRALQAAHHAKEISSNAGLMIALHSGDIYLGSIGHPDYAEKDILGETVNASFLVNRWVATHASTGIGLTQSVRDELSPAENFVSHKNISLDALPESFTIYTVE